MYCAWQDAVASTDAKMETNNFFMASYRFSKTDSRKFHCLKWIVTTYKRDVGIPCYSSHSQRLWHCPFVETSNAETHADMYINIMTCNIVDNDYLQFVSLILHTHGRLCCFDVWQMYWNCQIPESQAQSASNAFFIYRFSSLSFYFCKVGLLVLRTSAKIVKKEIFI